MGEQKQWPGPDDLDNMPLAYRGYMSGAVTYDPTDGLYHGLVRDFSTLIQYSGRDRSELGQAFRRAVDAFSEDCKRRGTTPRDEAIAAGYRGP